MRRARRRSDAERRAMFVHMNAEKGKGAARRMPKRSSKGSLPANVAREKVVWYDDTVALEIRGRRQILGRGVGWIERGGQTDSIVINGEILEELKRVLAEKRIKLHIKKSEKPIEAPESLEGP